MSTETYPEPAVVEKKYYFHFVVISHLTFIYILVARLSVCLLLSKSFRFSTVCL